MENYKVVFLQKYIPIYRKKFFDLLRETLQEHGIEMKVIYGQPGLKDGMKNDKTELSSGVFVKNQVYKVKEREFYYQPVLYLLKDADLIIVEQANKLLLNYFLLLLNCLKIKKIAYWGHGKNFQANDASSISEMIKRYLANKVHWWFAYNDLSASVISKTGFPPEKITSVRNAVDTQRMIEVYERISIEDRENLKKELEIYSENIGLYVGGMYSEKRIEFLLETLQFIKEKVPDFEMIFIGDGPDAGIIKEASEKEKWIHFLGPKHEDEKVKYFAISKLFLMPGLVGLAILDCFALEVPLITTNNKHHSPEINYMENGINGLIIQNTNSPEVYGQAIVNLLKDEANRQRLIEGCRASKVDYTIENMVKRYAKGILCALQS